MSYMSGDCMSTVRPLGRVSSRRSLWLPVTDPRDLSASRIRVEPWILVLIFFLLPAGIASGESTRSFGAEYGLGQFYSLGELGELTVHHVSLSLVGQATTNNFFAASQSRLARSS